MKRDMDLVRAILLEMEKQPFTGDWLEVSVEGHSPEEISYHLILLSEAGLIVVTDTSTFTELDVKAMRLTWAGHEFLEASRDDARWQQAKSMMGKAGGFVFDVAKVVLIELIKTQVLSSTP